jgi:hypothetical protein
MEEQATKEAHMGGKRPDQYQIDPDEAGATDYKNYPDTPQERDGSKGAFSNAMKGDKQDQPIKPDVPAPDEKK